MTVNTLLSLLPWILPPIIGAVIGYVTNAIAIKMLFRPLKEIRILGIRLPFTPGIIPKQRLQLAESIGRMVSEQLITEEAIKTQIESAGFQAALAKTIAEATGSILDTPLSRSKEHTLPLVGDTLENFIKKILTSFLASKSFHGMAKKLLSHILGLVTDKKVGTLVKELGMEGFLKERLHTIIGEDAFRDRVSKTVQDWVHSQISAKKRLSVYIPEELILFLAQAFKSALPSLVTALLIWLKQAQIRQELEERGKLLIKNILEKLNLFQRLIVSIGQYDVALQQKMPEIVDDVIAYFSALLADPEQKERIVDVVKKAFLNWRKKDMLTLFGTSEQEVLPKLQSLINKFWQFLRKKEESGVLFRKIKQILERENSLTVGDLLQKFLGIHRERIVAVLLSFLEKEDFAGPTAEMIGSLIFEPTRNKNKVTLAALIGVDDARRTEINAYLVNAVNSLLAARLPEMMQSLDIQGLVENKINQLDVADVEALLLMVIAKHLKWINIFGAILGGIIGLSELVLRLVKIN